MFAARVRPEPWLRRGEHAVEPAQHRHGQHDPLVLRRPVRAAQQVGDLPDQGREKGVVGHLNRAGISRAPVNQAPRPLPTVDHTPLRPAGGRQPIGSTRQRVVNRSAKASAAHSISSMFRHGRRRRIRGVSTRSITDSAGALVRVWCGRHNRNSKPQECPRTLYRVIQCPLSIPVKH